MTVELIDGRAISEQVLAKCTNDAHLLKQETGVIPNLVALLVGDDPASAVYVRNKTRACTSVGIDSQTINLPSDTSEEDLLSVIHRLNGDTHTHGILVQLRLPNHVSEPRITGAISPDKDVDGVNPVNLGKLAAGLPCFVPATPAGIQHLLLASGHDPTGKHVVICGRSIIVGKSLALLLMQKAHGGNATVTVCHTKTRNIVELMRQADILVVDTGQPLWVKAEMVKPGAVIVDVGVNRLPSPEAKSGYRLVGDVDFDDVSTKASAITPVPGGVGPMTVAMVIANTIKAASFAVQYLDKAPPD